MFSRRYGDHTRFDFVRPRLLYHRARSQILKIVLPNDHKCMICVKITSVSFLLLIGNCTLSCKNFWKDMIDQLHDTQWHHDIKVLFWLLKISLYLAGSLTALSQYDFFNPSNHENVLFNAKKNIPSKIDDRRLNKFGFS